MDRTLLFAVSLALALSLSACNRTPAGSATPAAPAAPPELIPRDALFGNPERANVQISPDGRYLGWVAAVDGVLNVWVAPADDIGKARAVKTPIGPIKLGGSGICRASMAGDPERPATQLVRLGEKRLRSAPMPRY